jgi:hypothetical protein
VRGKNKFRSGEITAERAAAYEDYKGRLRALSMTTGSLLAGATVLELADRNGFGFAMREGLAHVTTPYLVVVQHDRNFRANIGCDLLEVVQAMHTHRAWLHYVGLATSRTIKHQHLVLSKYKLKICPFAVKAHQDEFTESRARAEAVACSGDASREVRLLPLLQWYDSTHVASAEYYRHFVFSRRVKRVARGGFIEDKLGQEQLRVILERGVGAHVPYGTFMLDDGSGAPVVQHLDGHDTRNGERFVHVDADDGGQFHVSTSKIRQRAEFRETT